MKKAKTNPDIVETQMTGDKPQVLVIEFVDPPDSHPEIAELRAALLEETMRAHREKFLVSLVRNVHWLLHEEQAERARDMLCIACAMMSGNRPPMDVLDELIKEMNAVSSARGRSDCQGSA